MYHVPYVCIMYEGMLCCAYDIPSTNFLKSIYYLIVRIDPSLLSCIVVVSDRIHINLNLDCHCMCIQS